MRRGVSRDIEKLKVPAFPGLQKPRRQDYLDESRSQKPWKEVRRLNFHLLSATHKLCDLQQVTSHLGGLSLLVNKGIGQAGFKVPLWLSSKLSVGIQFQLTILNWTYCFPLRLQPLNTSEQGEP